MVSQGEAPKLVYPRPKIVIDHIAHNSLTLGARQAGVVAKSVSPHVGGRRRKSRAEWSQPLWARGIGLSCLRQPNGQHPDERRPHELEAIGDRIHPSGDQSVRGPNWAMAKSLTERSWATTRAVTLTDCHTKACISAGESPSRWGMRPRRIHYRVSPTSSGEKLHRRAATSAFSEARVSAVSRSVTLSGLDRNELLRHDLLVGALCHAGRQRDLEARSGSGQLLGS